jgi:uncharacterized XkdX family phage protein
MSNYEMAKRNYDRGLWTDTMIHKLTEKGKLTAEEYKQITGKDY